MDSTNKPPTAHLRSPCDRLVHEIKAFLDAEAAVQLALEALAASDRRACLRGLARAGIRAENSLWHQSEAEPDEPDERQEA